MQTLTPDALSTLLPLAWRASPAATAAKWSKGAWRRAKHLTLLSDLIADGVAKGGMRLIVSMPPRHGKSEEVSHWTPAWFLANWPQKRVILASYEADFAATWGRKVRNTLQENPEMGVSIKDDRSATDDWETSKGGGMVTAGVGGPITGRGADLLIIDDPVKNAEEAASPVIREKIFEWWLTTARTRLEPGGSVIVVMTRWDVDDLAGRLQRDGTGQWIVVNLPAIAEKEGDALGRSLGDPLWPDRYGLDALHQIKVDLSPDAWASLYQQRPNPSGRGLYFDVDAINRLLRGCDEPYETRRGLVRIWKPREVAGKYIFGGDCAWGEKGAYSCVWLEDYATGEQVAEIYGRPALDDLADETVKLCREYNSAYGAVERNGEGRYVAEMLVELGYGGRLYWHDGQAKQPEEPGWLTTAQNRSPMLSDLETRTRVRGIVPHCRDACSEMLSFIRDEKGKPVPRSGTYSDHIMAAAICGAIRDSAMFSFATPSRQPLRRPASWAGRK